mmetsp:Transcript_121172/g.342853  ORF Transcript_121172/g.342853 Transcript_121172/m.342853 type:complete len:278 (+) Transcript_121172:709-1542(+)
MEALRKLLVAFAQMPHGHSEPLVELLLLCHGRVEFCPPAFQRQAQRLALDEVALESRLEDSLTFVLPGRQVLQNRPDLCDDVRGGPRISFLRGEVQEGDRVQAGPVGFLLRLRRLPFLELREDLDVGRTLELPQVGQRCRRKLGRECKISLHGLHPRVQLVVLRSDFVRLPSKLRVGVLQRKDFASELLVDDARLPVVAMLLPKLALVLRLLFRHHVRVVPADVADALVQRRHVSLQIPEGRENVLHLRERRSVAPRLQRAFGLRRDLKLSHGLPWE